MYLFAITVAFSILYIGQTEELKQRTIKHKSDIIHPNNSNCRKCAEHLRTSSYQFLY